MTSIANGEVGSAVRTTLNDLLTLHVNVLDFMSTPGIIDTDATAACQAAINAAAASGGSFVYFPIGTYIISSPGLQPSTAGRVSLIGAGAQVTILHGNFHGFVIDINVNSQTEGNTPPYTDNHATSHFQNIELMTIENDMQSPGAACTSGSVTGTVFVAAGTISGGLSAGILPAFQLGQTLYDPTTQVLYGDQILSSNTVSLSSITRSGTTATATTTAPHNLTNPSTLTLTISGSAITGSGSWDGTYSCTVNGASTFTFQVANSGGTTTAGGGSPGGYIGTSWNIDFNPSGGDVSGIAISSNGFDQTLGGIRFNPNDSGYLHDLYIGGWTGLSAATGCFNTIVSHCSFNPNGGSKQRGQVAAYVGNLTMISCTALGWWVGFAWSNADWTMIGCRAELNVTSLVIGMNAWALGTITSGFFVGGFSTESPDTAVTI